MVSIIIPVFNEEPYRLTQAIMSIMSQTYDDDIEIIVVDDGSDSGNIELYEMGIHGLKTHTFFQNRFISFYQKEHGGTAAALNYGLTKSKGDVIGWLSSDDLFFLDKIQTQMKVMNIEDSLWSFTGFVNEEKNQLVYYSGKSFFKQFCDFDNNQSMSQVIVDHFPKSCFINGCSVIFRRELIDKIGLFDEKLTLTQDYDMWIRMAYLSEPYVIVQPLVIHRSSGREYVDREIMKQNELTLIQKKIMEYRVGNFEIDGTN